MIGRLASIPLFPVLAVQAAWVVARAERLPEADGPRGGVAGQGRELRLLILGDSSAAGVGVATQDEALAGRLVAALSGRFRVAWRVEAASGATVRDALARLEVLAGQRFDVAVIALGVNDTKNGVRRRQWVARYAALIERLQARHGAALVCASGLPPMHRMPILPEPLRAVLGARARDFDLLLQQLAARSGAVHVPLEFDLDERHVASDGFHPGPEIYAHWARALAAVIREQHGGRIGLQAK